MKGIIFILAMLSVGFIYAEENIGKVSQPLVGGKVVTPEQQEVYALLTLNVPGGSCSASLLRNSWVITAAHCVETTGAAGETIVFSASSLRLVANWPTTQNRTGKRVFTFRPYDVAIIEVDPFTVKGDKTEYSRVIFQDGQFPYFGSVGGALITVLGRGINQFAQGSGSAATPAVSDGLFRVGFFKVEKDAGLLYWYPSVAGQAIAGGDSGGPTFAKIQNAEMALVGVHAQCKYQCLEGQTCAPGSWMWVKSTSECADAPIAPVLPQITSIIGPFVSQKKEPALEPPPTVITGTFGTTPPNLEPMWVYAIKENGDLLWYRKDNDQSPWQGPKQVGNGWANFVDVISAGGNNFYARKSDGDLLWYQHQGFSDGTFQWKGPVSVGAHWNTAYKIFSGGNGIVYRILHDGMLVWFKNLDFTNGVRAWEPEKVVGSGWQNFKHVFSTGKGTIFAITMEGQVLRYQHNGYSNGANSWSGPKTIGNGWDQYKEIVPCGGDVVFAIRNDGKMFWYRLARGGLNVSGPGLKSEIQNWEGPVEVGSGWVGFKSVIGLMPAETSIVR